MQIVIEIPEDIGRALFNRSILPDRAALEGLAAEAYRSGVLSEHQLMKLLQLDTRFAVHRWLEERNIALNYTHDDLASDLEALRELGLR
jgi:predicted HTH domain antitoxin